MRVFLFFVAGALFFSLASLCFAQKPFQPLEMPMPLPDDLKLLTVDDQVSEIPLDGRPVLVNLWASWCAPCLEELPSLNRLRASLPNNQLAMVALNYGDGLAVVRRFMEIHPIAFTVLLDITTLYSLRLEPVGLPVTYLVDGKGQVRYRLEGKAEWDSPEMMAQLQRLLGQLAN